MRYDPSIVKRLRRILLNCRDGAFPVALSGDGGAVVSSYREVARTVDQKYTHHYEKPGISCHASGISNTDWSSHESGQSACRCGSGGWSFCFVAAGGRAVL